ncbi:MAG: hypothetical protein M3Z65_08870 [Chloroflexota bacterium]|nr:hypothetical protein [Chloroflexota bacterium]
MQLFFVGLDLALVGVAAILLLSVLVRRGRGGANLALALLLIVLAAGLWYTSIRTQPLGL